MNAASESVTSASRRCRRAYEQLVRLAQATVEISQQPDEVVLFRAESISRWNTAEQLEHVAISNRQIVKRMDEILSAGEPEEASGPSPAGRVILLTGYIPRGIGKAPEHTLPRSTSLEQVRQSVSESQRSVTDLVSRLPEIDSCRRRFNHHVLGGFTPAQWLQFMAIHTRHHLKIIRDIQRARAQ
ncbi:MAG: DinB family protein [Gemmatimonadota bacterium]